LHLISVRRIRQRCQESVEIDEADADATIQLLGRQSAVMDQG